LVLDICLIDPTSNETAVSLLGRLVPSNQLRVLTLSDFPGEAGDTNYVSLMTQFQSCMAEGSTVVLVNCERIWTNFYDVFNRYFDRIPTSEPGIFEYYANLAAGTITQACKVHPNFKVVVHVPQSRLPECPVPFLDRFEKYTLSISQFLADEFLKLPKDKSIQSSDGKAARTSVLQLVKDGVDDMVQRLHVQGCQSKLFSNFDPEQSVDSLILRTLESSRVASSLKDPIIPPAIHVSAEESEELLDESDLIPDDVVDELTQSLVGSESVFASGLQGSSIHSSPLTGTERRMTVVSRAIRATNFLLLQLARPEAFFQCKQFPNAYAVEYLLRQEHFSVARFLSHITTHYKVEPRKLCIYSRGCGQLISAKPDSPLGHILQNRVARDFKVQMLYLSAPEMTAQKCYDFVAQLAQSSEKVLAIVSADVFVTSASQINWFRNAVDHLLHPEQNSVIIALVLHLSPESVFSSRSVYSAVYTNDWTFYHIDSLGLSEDSTNPVTPEFDARGWIAWGYGIKTANLTPRAAMEAMGATFFEVLEDVCLNSTLSVGGSRPVLTFSKDFYFPGPGAGVAARRFGAIKAILVQHPRLFAKLVARYAQAWSASLVHSVLAKASKTIASGGAVGSFVRVIQQAMRALMTPLVAQTFQRLASHFHLESVLQALEPSRIDSAAQTNHRLIDLVVNSIAMPSLSTEEGSELSFLYDIAGTSLTVSFDGLVPITPFFHVLVTYIREAHKAVVSRTKSTLLFSGSLGSR
jgi:hypothetical protein